KDGKLTTIEGAKELAFISDKTLKELNHPGYVVMNGKFKDVLPKFLPGSMPFDFVFIDGHHDKVATLEYFNIIYPYLSKKAVVIFDDINWSKGMQIVWKEIYNDQRIKMSFDLYKWGICLIDKTAFVDKMKCYKLVV
ncbi:MAG: class I SAM-dependent methyltransferase, partial [Bacteroidales bacterium]|nr:class I SAM-dependent methyltransferase [Bacteroidales bacterium]